MNSDKTACYKTNKDIADNKKIKIAFLIDTIDYETGGTERQLILLLKNLDRSKFEPYLCCFKNSRWLEDNKHNFNIYHFRFDSFHSFKDYRNLLTYSRFLRSQSFDIVQTHFRDGNIIGILAAKLAGVKVIISTRRNQGYWHDYKEIAILKVLNGFVTNFLANSKVVKSYVHNVEGVPKDKIEVIYNGFETNGFSHKFDDTVEREREKIGINKRGPLIVNISNLRPVKGVDVFLKAAQIVISRYENAHFLVVGHGKEKDRLVQLAENLGIDENVAFLGSRDDINQILAVCDIGVLTSHSEGLSNSIIEYMAAGLPVVCTDVGGNGELIVDNINGFLAEDNDHAAIAGSIIKLIESPDMMRDMGAVSLKRAHSTFDFKNIIKKTEIYYENLLFEK